MKLVTTNQAGEMENNEKIFLLYLSKAREKWDDQGVEEGKGVETSFLQIQGEAESIYSSSIFTLTRQNWDV